jgi:hypothetical protein
MADSPEQPNEGKETPTSAELEAEGQAAMFGDVP